MQVKNRVLSIFNKSGAISLSRRARYHIRCQEIIDDLHKRVADGNFIGEDESIRLYGKSDYLALMHELRLMNADYNYKVMTPALEWLYHSEHFKNRAADERKESRMYWVSIISACAAIASAVYTFFSNS